MSKKKAGPKPTAKARKRVPAWIWAQQQSINFEIEAIRRYVETVTSALEQEFKNYDAYLAKQVVSASDNEIQWLAEDRAEAEAYLVGHFPAFALETTFVATYSLLEDELIDLARVVGQRLGVKLDPDDLSDKGIHAAKKYLAVLCGIAFPESKHPWQEILHYNRLRNVCTHRRGRVKKDDQKIRKYVESNKSITIDQYDHLQLSREFCLEVLDTVEALMNDLFKLARDRVMNLQHSGDSGA